MYKKTTLSNGLRVVTHPMKERDSIALGFWVGVGGRYEDDRIKGAAHFLEHAAFKGSRKYSCQQIKTLIEGVGGTLNAFTSEEQTCFYAKIPSKHLQQTFDVLADMVACPRITPQDLEKEKSVIIEEIKMYHDLPQYFVLEVLDELLWPGHPLGKNLTGTPATIEAMSRESLKAFHSAHYAPGNIVVAASGRVAHEEIVDLSRKKFEKFPRKKPQGYIQADNSQTAPRLKFVKKNIEQMHLALGALGYEENHKDRYALTLLSVLLGGNMSSRLFVEVREKRGLAYSISCSAKTLHDTGIFLIRAGVDNQKIVDALTLILQELDKLKKKGTAVNEFRRTRDYVLGQMLIGLEDTMEHMLWIGESLISRNKTKTIKDLVEDFEKVTPDDIRRVAGEILDTQRYNLAVVGSLTDHQEKQLTQLIGM